MKINKLVINNIGLIKNEEIAIEKPLILFFGQVRQGKSTILNSVRWVCGGEFPSDIIRHGEKEASIELHFDGGMIGRSFYRAKDETTKARPVTFVKNGKPVPSPVSEIKRLLNPFLLDQDFLRNKTELERKQYFADLFAVDTTELDTEFFNSQRDAQALRSKISGYGEIDLTKYEPVDVTGKKTKLAAIRAEHQAVIEKVNADNLVFADHNSLFTRGEETLVSLDEEILKLKAQMEEKQSKREATRKWLSDHPRKDLLVLPPVPDTTELESQIESASGINAKAETYAANLNRHEQKKADEQKLTAMEARQREIKKEKQAKLKSISSECGIEGLEFDEAGNFIYEGTTAGMISDSQLMKLSAALSDLYPDGFGLNLLDRAESLGKSIFEFVDRAKAENKTILATIVGERPANVPPEVGVFVVTDGKVS